MFALFAGNTDEAMEGGIESLQALTPLRADAIGRLAALLESDSGLDWAHVADLDQPGLPIVAQWDGVEWHVLDEPRVADTLSREDLAAISSTADTDDLDDTDDEYDEDAHPREAEISALAALGSLDAATVDVVVLAEHRQSCDGPSVFGPFATAGEARDFVVEQYRDGEFDIDGCTVEYRASSR